MRDPKLIDKFVAALSSPAKRLLDELLRIAEPHSVPLYLVGGPLRDLILDRPLLDIDIAVEGDAPALAHELAQATGGRAVIHHPFLTSTVRIPVQTPRPGHRLDLITSRSETYAHPGALPTVKPATIREDLLRRDFTINALALRLNGPDAGQILDPTDGRRELDARLVRVLHEHSFQDDATRILRAFRYAARLGFEIEPETLGWLKRDIPYLGTISGARLHQEFARILAEEAPDETLRRLDEIGALAAMHANLRFEREHAEAFILLRDLHPTGARAAYWPTLAWRLTEVEAAALARRLALARAQRVAFEAMPHLRDVETALRGEQLKRSAIAELLSPFPLSALWALAALTDHRTARERLLDYLTKARHERPHLTGDDLLALGVPRGPQVGETLRRLTAARLDGEVISRADEGSLVRQLIAEGDKAHHRLKKKAPSRSS